MLKKGRHMKMCLPCLFAALSGKCIVGCGIRGMNRGRENKPEERRKCKRLYSEFIMSWLLHPVKLYLLYKIR